MLAYAREFTEGMPLEGGLPDADARRSRCATCRRHHVVDEIGNPDAARLHKATKTAPRVAVYTHKGVERLVENLTGERIHRAEALEIYAIDRALVAALASRLDRRMTFALSISDRELFVSLGTETLTGVVSRHTI